MLFHLRRNSLPTRRADHTLPTFPICHAASTQDAGFRYSVRFASTNPLNKPTQTFQSLRKTGMAACHIHARWRIAIIGDWRERSSNHGWTRNSKV
jgi:hypothetical protein